LGSGGRCNDLLGKAHKTKRPKEMRVLWVGGEKKGSVVKGRWRPSYDQSNHGGFPISAAKCGYSGGKA